MNVLRGLYLSAWRELWARPLWLALPWALLAVAAALPETVQSGWLWVCWSTLLPVSLGLLAVRGTQTADAFWRGLGLPGWTRTAGSSVVHLCVALPAMAAAYRLALRTGEPTTAALLQPWHFTPLALTLPMPEAPMGTAAGQLLYFGAVVAVYAALTAARTLLPPTTSIVGLLALAAVGLGGVVFSGSALGNWHPADGLFLRCVGFTALAAVGALWWETRLGPWGAAVKARAWVAPVLAVVALGSGSLVAEAAWTGGPLLHGVSPMAWDSEGRLLMGRTMLNDAFHKPLWLADADGVRRLPAANADTGHLGPGGQVLLHTRDARTTARLVHGDTVTTCVLQTRPEVGWRDAGFEAVAWHSERGVAWVDGAYAGAIRDGDCEDLGPATGVAWDGDALVVLRPEGTVEHAAGGSWPVPGVGELHTVGAHAILVEGRLTDRVRIDERADHIETTRVAAVTAVGPSTLAELDKWAAIRPVDRGLCVQVRGRTEWHCWDQDLAETTHSFSASGRMLTPWHVWNTDLELFQDLRPTGSPQPAPGGVPERGLYEPLVLDDDSPGLLTPTGIRGLPDTHGASPRRLCGGCHD